MRVRFSFLSTSICFSLSFPALLPAPSLGLPSQVLSLPPSRPFVPAIRRFCTIRFPFPVPCLPLSSRVFVFSIDMLALSYSFLIFLAVSPSPSCSLSFFYVQSRPCVRGLCRGKKTAATMASCLPFYGTLSLSVRVCQINPHSLVDRINALLTSTRFLANED